MSSGVQSATYAMTLTVKEAIADSQLANPATTIITYDQLNVTNMYMPGGSIPVSMVSAQELALTSGSLTLDLTALLGTNGVTESATGLKLQLMKIQNPASNGNMTFAQGGSNPYQLFGSTWSFSLGGGQSAMYDFANQAPTVSSTNKTIAVTGTGTQSFNLIMVFG